MPPPRKKRPPAGQSVPGAGTISTHRDAPRRSSGAAGQKPPERGRKNSPGGGRELCADCAHGRRAAMGGVWFREASHWVPAGAGGTPGRKNSPGVGRGLCAGCAHGGMAGNGGVWCREGAALGARRGREHVRAQKQPRRGPEAVWMRDMGVTCPGRSV